MKIKLTKEQMDKILEDRYLEICSEDDDTKGFDIYLEFGTELGFIYGEVSKDSRTGYCFTVEDLERLKEKKPSDPHYYSSDPLCPNCSTYMIYKFECCPKCGQRLDWRESK